MQKRQTALPPRNLIEILNETFVVFGRHIWQFTLLVIVVEGPVILAIQLWGNFPTVFNEEGALALSAADFVRVSTLVFLWLFSLSVVFGAVTTAVTQEYLTGKISIKACYGRVWWRVISMSLAALVLPIAFFLLSASLVFIIPAVAIFALLVYWSMTIPSVVVEGLSSRDALVRSYNLVRGSWWRSLAIVVVSLLVGFGFGILISLPVILIASIPVLGELSVVRLAFEVIADLITLGAVPAILFIIGTLLYLDLRVRKEDYNLETLALEMGVAKA